MCVYAACNASNSSLYNNDEWECNRKTHNTKSLSGYDDVWLFFSSSSLLCGPLRRFYHGSERQRLCVCVPFFDRFCFVAATSQPARQPAKRPMKAKYNKNKISELSSPLDSIAFGSMVCCARGTVEVSKTKIQCNRARVRVCVCECEL